MYHLRRLIIFLCTVSGLVFLIWLLPRILNPTPPSASERARDAAWVASSPFWFDRQACRWLSVCGAQHVKWDPPSLGNEGGGEGGGHGGKNGTGDDDGELLVWNRLELRSVSRGLEYDYVEAAERGAKGEATGDRELKRRGLEVDDAEQQERRKKRRRRSGRTGNVKKRWQADEATLERRRAEAEGAQSGGEQGQDEEGQAKPKVLKEIPAYVLDHAPLVHLYSGENFWPADIAEFVRHMQPFVNGTRFDGTKGTSSKDGGEGTTVGRDDSHVPYPELTLNNLTYLNAVPGDLCLQSNDDIELRPEWLHSHVGIPAPFEDGEDDDEWEDVPDEDDDEDDDYDLDRRPHRHPNNVLSPDDETTWRDVDEDHPLHRISDPRRLKGQHYAYDGAQQVPRQQERGAAGHRKDGRDELLAAEGQHATTPGGQADGFGGHHVTAMPHARPFWFGGGPIPRHFDDWDDEHQTPINAPQPQPPEGGGDDDNKDKDPSAPGGPGHPPEQPSGRSAAPAVLVVVDKGSGVVDAFWFFFYSYNLGQTVLRIRFGNHVGDWEHCMVRFEAGVPRAVFLSEHAGGQAYAWHAMEKRLVNATTDAEPRMGEERRKVLRPVVYSAVGSHAMYPAPGAHPYVLPFGLLADETDKGPLWDPAANAYAYHYDYTAGVDNPEGLEPAATNPDAATDWFHFDRPWGDELYPLRDERQWRLFGQYHYITGPRGPKFKNLARRKVCQNERCNVRRRIVSGATWAD